jgi:hypothetical protein
MCWRQDKVPILQVQGNALSVQRSNNPKAVAKGILCAANMQPGLLLDSPLETGGIPAIVRLLKKEPTCPGVLVYTTTLMRDAGVPDGRPAGLTTGLADKFQQAGECGMG